MIWLSIYFLGRYLKQHNSEAYKILRQKLLNLIDFRGTAAVH
jgi:hypothetical protein